MSDLVGNPEDMFSHNEAHIIMAAHTKGEGRQHKKTDFNDQQQREPQHYENMSFQHTAIFHGSQNEKKIL